MAGREQTLLELLGDHRLLVEHHRGILAYGTEEILIKASFGRLRVTGKELRLCCMSRLQLLIGGTVAALTLEAE